MSANLENSAVATEREKVSFHSNPKDRKCQRMFKLPHSCTHLTPREPGGLPSMGSHRVRHDWSDLAAAAAHHSKIMLKILQTRLQQYMNHELPDVQAGFRKGRGTRDQICQHPLAHQKSKRVPEKHLLLYWLCQSLWLCGSQQTVENSSRDGNTRPPDLSPEKSVCRSRSKS